MYQIFSFVILKLDAEPPRAFPSLGAVPGEPGDDGGDVYYCFSLWTAMVNNE